MKPSVMWIVALLLLIPTTGFAQRTSRALPPPPPPIPAEVLKKEQELLRGINPSRKRLIDVTAYRLCVQAATAADPIAAVKRATAAAFPNLRGRELEEITFLVEVQTIRILRLNYLIYSRKRQGGDPHRPGGSRGLFEQVKQTVSSTAAATDEARKQAEAEARRKADEARRAAEAVKRAADEAAKRAAEEAARKAQAEQKAAEEKLNTIGDDAQLANVDLQNILQKHQQTLQMMSNISKMLYDTAQSVIRKMGG